MSREETRKRGKYYSIIGGVFKTPVPENHPEAEVRHFELPDGTKGTKHEKTVHALFGKITDISLFDGDYGQNLIITLDENDDGDKPTITVGVATQFGEDFLKKLPSLDFDKEVRIRPYAFTPPDSDKEKRGVELSQQDADGKFTVRVLNFFYDAESKKAKNGYPTPDGDVSEYKSDDWKLFYLQARKFLVNHLKENVLPRFAYQAPKGDVYAGVQHINPDDIPF